MVMPLERLSAINSQIMNCQIPAHSVLNPTVIAAAEMARQPEGTLTAALDATQNPTVMAATEVATRFAEPMGLAALQMSNLQLDTQRHSSSPIISKEFSPQLYDKYPRCAGCLFFRPCHCSISLLGLVADGGHLPADPHLGTLGHRTSAGGGAIQGASKTAPAGHVSGQMVSHTPLPWRVICCLTR